MCADLFCLARMEGYVCACKSKHRGRERYEFSARYGVAGDGERLEDQTWRALAGGSGEDPIDRSAIVASISLFAQGIASSSVAGHFAMSVYQSNRIIIVLVRFQMVS